MNRNQKRLFIIEGLILSVLFGALVGCKSIIIDYHGKTVPEPNRIALLEGGPHRGDWKSKDLSFQYNYLRKSDILSLTGDLALNKEDYWSCEFIDYLYFRANFLDSDGKILESRVILNNSYPYQGGPHKWSIQSDLQLPLNTAAVSFSYMGRVSKDKHPDNESWNLYRSPLG